jgi:hypothetical protein
MRKVTHPTLILLPFAWLAMALCGCQEAPINPPALAEQAALNAREVVHQTGGGVSFTQSDDSGLRKIVTGMGHASDGLGGMASAVPPGMMSAMSNTPMARAAAGMPTLSTTDEQFDDTADDLRVWLRTRILADENLESQTSDQAVYLLHGDPTCRALPRDGDPAGTIPALDGHCADQLERIQVRVVLRADGDGVRLTLEVGPDKLELSAFVIHSNLLAIETDLAKAHTATAFIDQTLGNDSPVGTQFEALAGTVRVSLRKDGEKKVTFAVSVPAAIHVATKSAAGALGPDVQIAATDPLIALAADGVAQTATTTVNVGAVDVLTNWNPQGTFGQTPNRDLHVAVGGLTGATTFTEGVEELVSKGLGIGATSVQVRGMSIFDLDLNPSDMRRFDLRVSIDAAGEPHFEVTPRFDLSLGLHFGLITNDFVRESPPPSYTLDEVYRIRLDPGGATATVATVPASGTFMGGLAVGAGTLTLSSTKVADPIVVPAGKCLTGVSTVPPGAHPILGALSVVDCP